MEAFLRGVEEILARIDAVAASSPPGSTGDLLEGVVADFIDFLTQKDHYFRMMTHFMLDGDLAAELVEKLNNAARALLNRLEAIFAAGSTSEDPRAMARALFASVNGVLISFRNYPGRDRQAVFDHMQFLGSLIARRFS